jgi:P-type conjugative transfer protein TrbJ
MKHPLVGAIATTLLTAHVAGAQWEVIDLSNLVQSTTTAINSVQTAANTARQVVNTYTQIRNQVTQINNQLKNLERLDFNAVSALLHVTSSMVGTLREARGVSFELDRAIAEFDRLYPRVQEVLSAGEVLAMRRQWAGQRRDAAATAVQVQAVTQSLESMYTSLSQLLNRAAAAQGNLDVNQVQAQQNGVTQTLLMHIQQVLAGNGRVLAQQQAEDATLQEAALREIEAATRTDTPYTGARGRLATYRW